MKHLTKSTAILLCFCLLAALAGCGGTTETTAPSTESQPALTAAQKYDLARQDIDGAQNRILEYTTSETRLVGTDTYQESVTGTASFSGAGQDGMVAVVEEQVVYGTYAAAYTEIYCEGTAYAQVNGSNFSNQQTAREFVDRQVPAVLLDSALYASVTEQSTEDGSLILFEDAAGLESWVETSGEAQLITAGGTASLDAAGVLLQTTYYAQYTRGEAQYAVEVTVRVTAPKSLDLGAIHSEHITGSTVIQDLAIPKMLLRMVGDVYTSQSMTCNAVESIYSEAIPVSYTQESAYSLHGAGDTLKAEAKYTISLSDYRGEASTKHQVDSFDGGVFTSEVDGTAQQQSDITAQTMRQYLEDAILSGLMAPKYLAGATLEEADGQYRLEFTGNDTYVADMMVGITQFLQVDLEAKAEAIQGGEAAGYLTIDTDTLLPVTMGLSLSRTHTIDSVPYLLTYQLDQTMTLSGEE